MPPPSLPLIRKADSRDTFEETGSLYFPLCQKAFHSSPVHRVCRLTNRSLIMSTLPAEEARTENAESLLELATRITKEITEVRTQVHEDKTTSQPPLEDMAKQLEIDNSLATVIAAAYLPLAKSRSIDHTLLQLLTPPGNGHMTRCTAIGSRNV